ncbi:class I SAM-dependent methyltransferase [uncultured Phenylobacterium sp.]|uniref:class I SAM-dependent methyltransferase n=1 Tax=uncultured Phenylobacterium sp. TaxID=349273 RepID=UPI0025D1740F|nr:class I SAM-dependent methyltransferase [uncultured Phenylobacterium sp.]
MPSPAIHPSPPAWAPPLFQLDLEPAGPPGVWGLSGAASTARISSQFTSEAETYHARYSASAHFEGLIAQAIAAAGVIIAEAPLVLDMGSGSGVNSILPGFNLFPGARQVATDLSAELLAVLARQAEAAGLGERVVCVVMDAMQLRVRNRRFDLVTGASVLHHLEHPADAIEGAFNALKPGGHAIFMEPFDGYGLIRLAYERILAEADLRGDPLAPAVAAHLTAMVEDIAMRTRPDRASAAFAHLDDKWLFAREILEAQARKRGFEAVRFVPHHDHETLYRDIAHSQLRLATGESHELPAWATDILDSFDQALPPAVKRLLMLEGSVVMSRAA